MSAPTTRTAERAAPHANGAAGTAAPEPTNPPAKPASAGQKIEFGVRPEHITIEQRDGRIPFAAAKVDLVENLGGQTLLYTTLADGQSLTISLDGQRAIEVGATVETFIDPATCHLFDAEGRIIFRGSPREIERSDHPYVRRFLHPRAAEP